MASVGSDSGISDRDGPRETRVSHGSAAALLPGNSRQLVQSVPRRARLSLFSLSLTGWFLLTLLAVALLRGVAYALLNPPFGSPDERDHFQYVASLATAGAAGPRGREGHQPILYYALMTPAYWLSAGWPAAGQLLVVRLASLPFLLGQVWLAWLAGRKLAPRRTAVAALSAAMVALQPQLAYIGSSANNDSLANFVAALLVYLAISMMVDWRWWLPAAAGMAVGAAVLSKGQLLPIAALVLLVLVGKLLRRPVTQHSRTVLLAAPALLLIGGAMMARESSVLLERTQFLMKALQRWPQAVESVQNYGNLPYEYALVSFWAAFLGESVRPFAESYLLPSTVVLVGLAGLLLGGLLRGFAVGSEVGRTLAVRGFLALVIPVQFAMMYLFFVQSVLDPYFPWTLQYMQGRYLFPVLLPLALLVAEGWDSALRTARLPWLVAVPIAAFACFDALSFAAMANYYSWMPAA